MLNSVSSSDTTTPTAILLESSDSDYGDDIICNSKFSQIYIIFGCFAVVGVVFTIYTFVA